MSNHGPFAAIGVLVKKARKNLGMSRRKLGWWVRQHSSLGLSQVMSEQFVRELEDQGEVTDEGSLYRILEVLDIADADVADLLAQAKAAENAALAADLKSAAATIARDQGRPASEIEAGLARLAKLMRGRPMA